MKLKPLLLSFAALALAGTAQAQTKWDMPTPYSDGEFHTINVRQFVEDVKKASGGQIDMSVQPLAPVMAQVKAGKGKVLGILSTKRFAGLPDIPESRPHSEVNSGRFRR